MLTCSGDFSMHAHERRDIFLTWWRFLVQSGHEKDVYTLFFVISDALVFTFEPFKVLEATKETAIKAVA